jgi:hypothetical protein
MKKQYEAPTIIELSKEEATRRISRARVKDIYEKEFVPAYKENNLLKAYHALEKAGEEMFNYLKLGGEFGFLRAAIDVGSKLELSVKISEITARGEAELREICEKNQRNAINTAIVQLMEGAAQ